MDLAAANIPLSHARPHITVGPQLWRDWVAQLQPHHRFKTSSI